jgi:hypothetical protein
VCVTASRYPVGARKSLSVDLPTSLVGHLPEVAYAEPNTEGVGGAQRRGELSMPMFEILALLIPPAVAFAFACALCWKWQRKMARLHEEMDRRAYPPSSGNRAFDEYRAETLRLLEEEQRDFHDFLDRLRHAKNKAEFDQFMAERFMAECRNRPLSPLRPLSLIVCHRKSARPQEQ